MKKAKVTKLDIDLKGYPKKPLFHRVRLLAHEQIPKPMHGVNPRTVMGKEWWNEHRERAYAKNNYCCWACGDMPTRLEAHEVYDILGSEGRMVFVEIVALCHDCHMTIHVGLTEKLKGIDEVKRLTKRKMKLIRKHAQHQEVPWNMWRLVFEGKEYKPVHETYDDWLKHYDN